MLQELVAQPLCIKKTIKYVKTRKPYKQIDVLGSAVFLYIGSLVHCDMLSFFNNNVLNFASYDAVVYCLIFDQQCLIILVAS